MYTIYISIYVLNEYIYIIYSIIYTYSYIIYIYILHSIVYIIYIYYIYSIASKRSYGCRSILCCIIYSWYIVYIIYTYISTRLIREIRLRPERCVNFAYTW